ncbi:unnamed protein product [Rotaria sp. Silwood2]|nr:unnamed protein product [Rotaria sp. Silwood2]CAF4000133.1 unnamed protein product [Rotaria sp. Silwood2]
MSLIKSSKGNDRLLLDGFRYRRERTVWRCVKDKCKGRARSDGNTFKMYQDRVCQASDPDEIEKALFNYEIRTKAAECHASPRLIIHEARFKLSSDAAITNPQYNASQRVIQRIRRDENIPSEPKTFADIVIVLNFQITITNEKFILYDNNDDNRRLLIFASKEQLGFLNQCESWHCDGTFAVAPKMFEQMYSVHGSIRGKSLPLEIHLKKEFLENDVSRRTMKNLAALSFIPPQNVIEEFVRIKENASDVLDGK